MSTITAEKAALRERVKAFYLCGFDRQKSDLLLLSRFLTLPQVGAAHTLLLFWGVDTEPETARLLEPLLELDKRIALPRCLPLRQMEAREYRGRGHLAESAYGIPEPDEECPVLARDSIDLILVPNLCCDRRGMRLGHGGGYYDRYLRGFHGTTVALCRDGLLFDRLPTGEYDLPAQIILTETECLSRE